MVIPIKINAKETRKQANKIRKQVNRIICVQYVSLFLYILKIC